MKFVCTADTDPEEIDNLVVDWYKDGNLIDSETTPRIDQVFFDYSLVIAGAQALDTGQYRCNASNGLDFAAATASLLVQGQLYFHCSIPLLILVICYRNNSRSFLSISPFALLSNSSSLLYLLILGCIFLKFQSFFLSPQIKIRINLYSEICLFVIV